MLVYVHLTVSVLGVENAENIEYWMRGNPYN